jgi:hypothetical protein
MPPLPGGKGGSGFAGEARARLPPPGGNGGSGFAGEAIAWDSPRIAKIATRARLRILIFVSIVLPLRKNDLQCQTTLNRVCLYHESTIHPKFHLNSVFVASNGINLQKISINSPFIRLRKAGALSRARFFSAPEYHWSTECSGSGARFPQAPAAGQILCDL